MISFQRSITALIGLLLGRIRHQSTSEGLRIIEKYASANAIMFLGR